MIKLIFILFFVGICTRQNLLVSGLNCTEPSAYNTDECVFECIKNLYDTEYCTSCDVGDKVTKIDFSSNQTLTSLMKHDLIFFNDSTESIATGNCSACTVEKNDQSLYERFKTPIDLLKFFNCTNGVAKTNCTTIEVEELYANISKRLEKEQWCMKTLDMDDLYSKQSIVQPMVSTKNETSNNNATDNGTATEQILTSTEASATTDVVPSRENVDEENKKPTDAVTPQTNDSQTTESGETTVPLIDSTTAMTTTPNSTTTADIINQTTTIKPESTTKSKTLKKKKIVEDHHYHGSITIIASIVGILLTVLVALAVVVRILIARRKKMHPRTSSTTYVFESHQF